MDVMELDSSMLQARAQKMDKEEKSHKFSSSTISFRRLSVLQGHLKSGSSRATRVGASPCTGGTKVAVQSSAPMSSKVAEVQKAFPRQRLVDNPVVVYS